MQNPFVYGEVVPAAAFADRAVELDRLVGDLAAAQKVLKELGAHPQSQAPVKLLDVVPTGRSMPVYDIEVDCDTHSFIADNVIVHNSICTTRVVAGIGVPQITAVLVKQKASLPLPTEILMAVSGAVRSYWWMGILAVAGAWFLVNRVRKTRGGRLWMDTMLLRIPVVGPLLRKSAVSRFALTFATLLESGLPVLECVAVVKRVVNNQLIANVLDDVQRKIAEGADIATPMKQSKVFPPVVGYMIAVGEESGHLEELLKRVAAAYDEEVELAAQKLTSLLEPAMIVAMALVVGFIVLSILLPILQMSNV